MLLKILNHTYKVKRLYDSLLESRFQDSNLGSKIELGVFIDEPFIKFEEIITNLHESDNFSLIDEVGSIIATYQTSDAVVIRTFEDANESSEKYAMQIKLTRIV